ncbi:MAG: aldo/keto reductase [Magnetococcales bacterium]|nr:aldo/keto reductase [Magnetococcales bacterium]
MITRPFGKTGLQLTPLTVGGMRFLHGWDAPHDELPEDSLENVATILQSALAAGINHIETARAYGKSERLIGQVIHQLPFPRTSWHIMSKTAPTADGRALWQTMQESMQRLAVDYLDLFALHGINSLDQLQMALEKCLPVLNKARKEGWLEAVGFSTHGTVDVILAAIESGAFDFVNLHYNYFNPRNAPAVQRAAQRGMGVMIISPNEKAGYLYTPTPELTALTAPLHPAVFNERWLLQQTAIGTLSIGMSEAGHLPLHLQAVAQGWGEEEARVLHRLQQEARRDPRLACSQCQACLPCPKLINIPEVMRLSHGSQFLGIHDFARSRYGQFRPHDPWVQGAKGDECNQCGDCLPRCPHKLDIPQLLKEAHARLG